VLACELPILLICVVVKPTDALTGEVVSKISIIRCLLPQRTPPTSSTKYVTGFVMHSYRSGSQVNCFGRLSLSDLSLTWFSSFNAYAYIFAN